MEAFTVREPSRPAARPPQQQQRAIRPGQAMPAQALLGLQRSAGNRAVTAMLSRTRTPPRRVTGRKLQRANRILSHVYEWNENPINTIVRFVSRSTGRTPDEVFAAIDDDDNLKIALRDEGNYKPISVKAYIDGVTGSAGRGGSDIQRAIGHLGRVEDKLRGRPTKDSYHGGHLLGYGWYKHWPLVNTAKNIAPQWGKENSTITGGKYAAWGWEEHDVRKELKGAIVLTAYVNYAGGTYTVSLRQIADTILKPTSAVKKEIDLYKMARLSYVVLNARVPKQYVLEHTFTSLDGPADENEHVAGALPTARTDTRIPRSLLYPVEDAVTRNLLPFWRSLGGQSEQGGAVLSKNQDWTSADFANDALKLAQFAVYALMYGYGMPASVAAGLVASYYFGAGSAASTVALLTSLTSGGAASIGYRVFGDRGFTKWVDSMSAVVTPALTTGTQTLTTDTALGYTKSALAYASSRIISVVPPLW
jgi:hypothetical protein